MSKKKFGRGSRVCKVCGTHRAIIRRYNLYICRRCFREKAVQIGFKKYN
ncbi:MAG: 30S ribosomal protein S14 [Candidatus Freyarchaeum deiterrae]